MFIFNGYSSKDMSISCKDENFTGRASLRYATNEFEGGNGTDYYTDGYATVEKSIELFLHDKEREDEVLSWLNGKGTFIFNGRKTTAYFLNEIVSEDLIRKKRLTTTFIRNPFWTLEIDDYMRATSYIINNGTVYSEPLLMMKGKNGEKVTISINDVTFLYTFDKDETIYIDCEKGLEYNANGMSKSKNIEIGFLYPRLQVGKNSISIDNKNIEVYVKRKDRWI